MYYLQIMEMLFQLRLGDLQQPNDYYMCKSCTTDIALVQHFQQFYCTRGVFTGLFNIAVNVRVDEAVLNHFQIDSHTLARIYCVNCGDVLGHKYVRVAPGQTHLQNEMVLLNIEKLSRRCGEQIVSGYALVGQIISNLQAEDVIQNNGAFAARVRHS